MSQMAYLNTPLDSITDRAAMNSRLPWTAAVLQENE